MDQRRCPNLPPDVLREISGRLHHVIDFVRFHAVCRTWRDSHDPKTTKQPSLLPWLLSTNMDKCDIKFRCVFSRTSYHSSSPADKRTWVASADGTAVWYLTDGPCPSLHDPLTGAAVAHLPVFPDKWEKGQTWGLYCYIFGTMFGLSGIVCRDGAIFLYGLHEANTDHRPTFRAALLRPGDTTWTVVERTFEYTRHFFAAYHQGKIIVIVGPNLSHIVMPGDDIDFNDVSVPRPSMLSESEKYIYEYGYALETRGELLWVSVHVAKDYEHKKRSNVIGLLHALSISVHVLENEVASGNMRWVGKDKRRLADRVLFLGSPNSFAVDASQFGGDVVSGGCAYFVDYEDWRFAPGYVLRYSFIDDKAKFVEQLPQGWDDAKWMWLFPEPTVARIKENSAMLDGAKWWWKKPQQVAPTPRSIINIERPQQQNYKSYFKVVVCNLPSTVDSSQLQQFFSKYGKVFDAKVICKKKTKIPKLFGRVTIAMVEELVDGLAALDRLVFYGCILEVRLVKIMRQLDQHANDD